MGTPIVVREIFRNGVLLEDAELIRGGGSFNSHGEWTPTQAAPVAVRVITAPVGEERETEEGGLRSEAERSFWLRESVVPVVEGQSGGDIIRYAGIDYAALEVHEWGEFVEVLAVAADFPQCDLGEPLRAG